MKQHLRRAARAALTMTAVAAVVATSACSSQSPAPTGGQLGGTVTALINPEQNTGLSLFYDAFAKETGVTIDAEYTDTNSLVEQLRVQITSGTAPDLFRSAVGNHPVGVYTLEREGYLLDLTDQPWVSTLPESFLPLIQIDGKIRAYPTSGQGIVMFYNKAVFADLGLSEPKTWSEFIAVSEAVKAAGKVPISLGLGTAAYIQFMPFMLAATLVSSQEKDFYARMDAGEVTFATSPEWREVFEKFFGLIDDGLTTPSPLGMPGDQAMQAVATGDAAMIPLVSSNLPALAEYFADGVDGVGVFALPASDNAGDTWVPFSPDLLSINAEAKNPDGAKAFLSYIATPERATEYATATATVPALVGAAPVESAVGAVLGPLVNDGRAAPFSVHRWPNGEVQQSLIQDGQLVAAGELSIDELLERMDQAYAKGTP